MFYEFVCPSCNKVEERWESMNDPHIPGKCECGTERLRVFSAVPTGDEFGEGIHFNPVTKKTERYRNDHFDMGLGKWVSGKSERRYWMKKMGLQEHPNANKQTPEG